MVFHVKAKNERFTAARSRCRQNLKYENFTSSFGRLRQNIASKSVPQVQHDSFSSFNQLNLWFVALSLSLSLTLPSSNLKLPITSSMGHDALSPSWMGHEILPWWYMLYDLSPTSCICHEILIPSLRDDNKFAYLHDCEMTCFAVLWTTWELNDTFSMFSFHLQTVQTILVAL